MCQVMLLAMALSGKHDIVPALEELTFQWGRGGRHLNSKQVNNISAGSEKCYEEK